MQAQCPCTGRSDKRILIVDDDPGVCNSLAILLRGEGYSVDESTDSREATALLHQGRYDICFFDYKMDGLNGMDLLRMARDINPRSSVFIISGMDIDDICHRGINTGGMTDSITKPFDIEMLLQKIEMVFDGAVS